MAALDPSRIPWTPLALSVAVMAACTPDFPEVSWIGPHLQVAKTAEGPVCGGTNPYQDRYVERLADLLGVAIVEPILFAYIDDSEIEDYCFDELWGCYYDGKAYSIMPTHTHELAHAVADRAGWDGPRALTEGFAEAYGFNSEGGLVRLPIRGVVEDFDRSADSYYTAGLFVRFLVDRHGLGPFGELMRATDSDSDFDEVAAAFEAHLGEPIEAAFEAFEATYPTCSAWSNQAAIVECGLDPSPWVGESLEITVALDCADEATIGPNGSDPGEAWAPRSFEIPEGGLGIYKATVTATGDAPSGVRITHCGGCEVDVDIIVGAGVSRTVALPAGRYYVDFVAAADAPMSLTLRLQSP